MIQFMMNLDYSPLWISLKTGVIATAITGIVGIALAYFVMSLKGYFKYFIDSLLTLPMVLPPTVAGFILLVLFSKRRPIGMFLDHQFQIQVVQHFLGCVLAAVVISLPLMYRSAKASFEQVDQNTIWVARTLGISEGRIFFCILLPQAKQGLISGMILAFARAMGEYGATAMLAGNIPGKTSTISQKIAMVMQDGDYQTAGFWVIIVLCIAMGLLMIVNRLTKENYK